jgi:hypothetical protein
MDWGGDGYSGNSAVLIEIVGSGNRYLKGLFLSLSEAKDWLRKQGFADALDNTEIANLQQSLPPTFLYKDKNILPETWLNRELPAQETWQLAYIYQMQRVDEKTAMPA